MSCFCQVAEERARSIHSFFQKLGSMLKQRADARPQGSMQCITTEFKWQAELRIVRFLYCIV